MKTNLETIKESAKNNSLYNFFKNNEFWKDNTIKLDHNKWRGVTSKWSLRFVGNKSDGNELKNIFSIKDTSFNDKYVQAINGNGNEGNKIYTLHSSSLLQLLVFSSVSEDNPIYFNLGNEIKEFSESKFEVKNEVSQGSNKCSNIDIVLSGKDYILCLESKFSEYLSTGSVEVRKIDYYETIYEKLDSFLEKAQVVYEKGEKCTLRKKGTEPIYCKGLKQMISHYLGISTEICKDKKRKKEKRKFDNKKVYLGEILFDFKDNKKNSKLSSYMKAFSHIKDGLQQCADEKHEKGKIIIMNPITYQSILEMKENQKFLKNLPEKVRLYYRFNELCTKE